MGDRADVTRSRRIGRSLLWPVRIVAAVATVAVTVLFAVVGIKALNWPDVAALSSREPETTAFMEQARTDGIEVRWRFVPYGRISNNLKRAVVVAEDISFFSHNGFDTQELKVAAREAIEGKRVRGASTITQQLAKNLWLSPSRSPVRKLDEAVLTWQLERRLDKRRILELYLNVVEFGPGVYGAEAAARHYFGTSAAELSEHQSAELAASLPRPSSWHPGITRRGYLRYVDQIRSRMERAAWVDKLL
jgi:monofunctional biosynthetic peptidoglycan transglycosylase